MAFKRILVAVDYSPSSRAALEYAAELAVEFGSHVTIVHVWDRPTYVSDTAVIVDKGHQQRSLGDLIRENAEREMQEFLASARLPAGLRHEERMLSGDPATALLKHAEAEKYDVIVTGTQGRSGFAHLLLGSVAEKIVRYSPIPVLTVPGKRGA
jgi:nucleotide-binding universal stress UspA family protein